MYLDVSFKKGNGRLKSNHGSFNKNLLQMQFNYLSVKMVLVVIQPGQVIRRLWGAFKFEKWKDLGNVAKSGGF